MALLNNKVPGRMSLNYYMCTGEDPRNYEDIKPKVSFYYKSWIKSLIEIYRDLKSGVGATLANCFNLWFVQMAKIYRKY